MLGLQNFVEHNKDVTICVIIYYEKHIRLPFKNPHDTSDKYNLANIYFNIYIMQFYIFSFVCWHPQKGIRQEYIFPQRAKYFIYELLSAKVA